MGTLLAVLRSLWRSHTIHAILGIICLLGGAVALSSCNLTTQDDARPQDVIDKIRALDLTPRFSHEPNDVDSGRAPRAAVYEGRAVPTFEGVQPTPSGDGYELNFENTPVTTVAKVILGDILGLGYTIDPRVQGTISLSSGRPVPKSEVLYVLENALRAGNVVMIRDSMGYRLVPLTEAAGAGGLDRSSASQPGYGISVVPLQYVSAPTLQKILDSFATKAGTVRADPGRNLLMIQGSGPERRAAMDTVLSFDVDWMRGQSVGIYPIRNSTPEPVITELEKIIDSGEGGLSQNLVKLQPIARLNAILVVSRKESLLRTVSTWITRLDMSDTTTTGVKVYRVRYGDARQMARLLNDMFVGGAGGPTLESPANQLAPGSGMVTTSSGLPPGPPPGPSINRPVLSNAPQSPTAGEQNGVRLETPIGGAPGIAGSSVTVSPGILPGVRITADVVNNSLLIFANRESYQLILRALHQIDRPQLQVAIDATIAEVTLNDTLNYGVQFFLKSSDLGIGKNKGSLVNSIGNAALARTFPGFNLLVGSEAEPRMILDALHNVTDVKVLSNPSVVVLDNQVATLQVGDEIPITTGTATVLNSSNQVVNTIAYRNTGIILRVIPRVNYNGNVVLDIEQEISSVTPPPNGDTTTLTPTVSQRKVKSSIAVASGQTVLLAGLISERRDKDRSGIPILDSIPKIGDAFAHQNGKAQRVELIMFIRPQIIRDSVDAHYVAEELRTKMGGQRATVAPSTPVPPPLPKQR